jgi:hypothetical protein
MKRVSADKPGKPEDERLSTALPRNSEELMEFWNRNRAALKASPTSWQIIQEVCGLSREQIVEELGLLS